ncbi:uncharacterized protein N7498_004302 [Penicillium cinerascens]|uniref:Methyltransferase domain-containing protein n=1 Tax=Penicillium cinerascens TaxID=70096 RepID=A0A9W9N3U8_9EURO|nr:uncharacterized protein N7498_004302 [Penicillium cinerascens]KAJ5212656.1 hypothetical protein N7498_004302 [Penicillium cinerascens]
MEAYSDVNENGKGVSFEDHDSAVEITSQSIINFEPATCQQGEILANVSEPALRNNLVAICHSTLKILQPAQQSGLFRLEFRNDSETKQPKLHGIEPQPRIFALDGVGLDDALVRSTVPGGHAALFSFLTILQVSDYGALKEKQQMAEFYADYAVYYDEEMTDEIGYCRHQQIMASQFDWTGTVLDVACGTGALGRYLSDGEQDCKIFGIDLSLEMTNTSSIRKYYQLPITIGTMQAAMMQPEEYDHVACFGGLDYLGDDDFRIVLSRMFSVARKSVSFNVEQPTSEYWAKMAENPSIPPSYDHSKKLWDDFQIPVGWELVYDKRDMLYHDNQLDCDIAGCMVRLERL